MRAADTALHEARWLDQWEALLAGSLPELVDALLSRSQSAGDLRQSTPFAGVLMPEERLAAMRGVRRDQLEPLIRAAGAIAQADDVVVIGSQARLR